MSFWKKEKSLLKDEDISELEELERKAYLEEARKLVVERGKNDARKNIGIKKEDPYV